MVGCGNSKMSEEMARDGYPFIDNMDISSVVLEKMRQVYKETYRGFEFTSMDATHMNYRDNSFDVCVDKGTFDATKYMELKETYYFCCFQAGIFKYVDTLVVTFINFRYVERTIQNRIGLL